jgi:hypothetical protein
MRSRRLAESVTIDVFSVAASSAPEKEFANCLPAYQSRLEKL